jgi:hypothetical protein
MADSRTEAVPEVCETCGGKGYYHTGSFVGDIDDLRSIVNWCPDCPLGLAKASGVDTQSE